MWIGCKRVGGKEEIRKGASERARENEREWGSEKLVQVNAKSNSNSLAFLGGVEGSPTSLRDERSNNESEPIWNFPLGSTDICSWSLWCPTGTNCVQREIEKGEQGYQRLFFEYLAQWKEKSRGWKPQFSHTHAVIYPLRRRVSLPSFLSFPHCQQDRDFSSHNFLASKDTS